MARYEVTVYLTVEADDEDDALNVADRTLNLCGDYVIDGAEECEADEVPS